MVATGRPSIGLHHDLLQRPHCRCCVNRAGTTQQLSGGIEIAFDKRQHRCSCQALAEPLDLLHAGKTGSAAPAVLAPFRVARVSMASGLEIEQKIGQLRPCLFEAWQVVRRLRVADGFHQIDDLVAILVAGGVQLDAGPLQQGR